MKPNIFSALLEHRQTREVNVSQAFAVCFSNSRVFRAKVIRALSTVGGIPRMPRGQCDWSCATEVVRKHGRLDLLLTPNDGNSSPVVLENKVAAALTKSQMLRYRRGESGKYIVAITKRHPEAGKRWLETKGCFAIRWQDIHQALASSNGRGADAYLCRSFSEYLEEIDMAYKGNVTTADLRRVTKLLAATRADRQMSEIRAAPAFRAAIDVLGLLDEIMTDAKETIPVLAKWPRWGPSYFKWREDGEDSHHFAFRLKKKGWKQWCGAGFVLPQTVNGRIAATTISSVGGTKQVTQRFYYAADWTRRDGSVDAHALTRLFVKHVRGSGLL